MALFAHQCWFTCPINIFDDLGRYCLLILCVTERTSGDVVMSAQNKLRLKKKQRNKCAGKVHICICRSICTTLKYFPSSKSDKVLEQEVQLFAMKSVIWKHEQKNTINFFPKQ